jgi:phage gp16-like protein
VVSQPFKKRTPEEQWSVDRSRIHVLLGKAKKAQPGFTDDNYRDLIGDVSRGRCDSSKELTSRERLTLIERLQELAGEDPHKPKRTWTKQQYPGRPKNMDKPGQPDESRSDQLGKIEALLTIGKLSWKYADAIAQQMRLITITRKMLAGDYRFRSKASRVYRAARVTYWNPKLKKDVTRTIQVASPGVKWGGSGDTLTLVERCESLAQAKRKAQAAVRRANGRQTEGNITLFGQPHLVAGVNLATSGWGKLDGTYQAVKTVHCISRGEG